DPLAEPGAAVRRGLALAQLDEQALVGVDGDAPAVGAGGAAVAEGAGGAGLSREADRAAGLEGEDGAARAADRARVPVEREGGLVEAVAVADRPGLAEEGEVGRSLTDQGAAEVGSVDVQLGKPGRLVVE